MQICTKCLESKCVWMSELMTYLNVSVLQLLYFVATAAATCIFKTSFRAISWHQQFLFFDYFDINFKLSRIVRVCGRYQPTSLKAVASWMCDNILWESNARVLTESWPFKWSINVYSICIKRARLSSYVEMSSSPMKTVSLSIRRNHKIRKNCRPFPGIFWSPSGFLSTSFSKSFVPKKMREMVARKGEREKKLRFIHQLFLLTSPLSILMNEPYGVYQCNITKNLLIFKSTDNFISEKKAKSDKRETQT